VDRGLGSEVSNNSRASDVRLLRRRNRPPQNRWLVVRLIGSRSNRDGIGARVLVGNQVRTMTTASGYASSSHAGLHFGVGSDSEVPRLEVHWPSGTRQTLENVKTNQVLEIREIAPS